MWHLEGHLIAANLYLEIYTIIVRYIIFSKLVWKIKFNNDYEVCNFIIL